MRIGPGYIHYSLAIRSEHSIFAHSMIAHKMSMRGSIKIPYESIDMLFYILY